MSTANQIMAQQDRVIALKWRYQSTPMNDPNSRAYFDAWMSEWRKLDKMHTPVYQD